MKRLVAGNWKMNLGPAEASLLVKRVEQNLKPTDNTEVVVCPPFIDLFPLARELDLPVRPVWDLFLRFAVSEEGALHAEKFYRTATEEFASLRPAFRNRQLIALARVTASAHGRTAPGYQEACRLLGV